MVEQNIPPQENSYENKYLDQMEQELMIAKTDNARLINSQSSPFSSPSEENLIRYQLDLKEDIDKIYHLLKGDIVSRDDKDNIVYIEPDNDDEKPFNEFGVKSIMNIMSFYLNRNTLLSNYDNDTIMWKVKDFGDNISDEILCKFKQYMLTTSFEREFFKEYGYECFRLSTHDKDKEMYAIKLIDSDNKLFFMFLSEDVIEKINIRIYEHLERKVESYPMIIHKLTDTVHSAYLRALAGGERTSLREARLVHQNESIGNRMNMPMQQNGNQNSVKWYNPFSWGGNK